MTTLTHIDPYSDEVIHTTVTADEGEYLITTDDNHSAITNGECADAITTGNYSNALTNGGFAHAITTGSESNAEVWGRESVAAVFGYWSKARGVVGSWLILSECSEFGTIEDMKTIKIDGEKYKANTWYQLKNGEIVEILN